MESQANFLGALNPTLEKMYSSTFAGAKNVLLDIPPAACCGRISFRFCYPAACCRVIHLRIGRRPFGIHHFKVFKAMFKINTFLKSENI